MSPVFGFSDRNNMAYNLKDLLKWCLGFHSVVLQYKIRELILNKIIKEIIYVSKYSSSMSALW